MGPHDNSGSNHREESDRRPIALCPQYLAKVCWAARIDPIERFTALYSFSVRNALKDETAFHAKSIRALGGRISTTQPTNTTETKPASR